MKAASHLIHVGFPKCASTFLQRWFESHPDIHYREGAIGGFESTFGIADLARANGPRLLVTSTERFVVPLPMPSGDQTIDKSIQSHAPDAQARLCDLLAALSPGASILIVVRGYAELFKSLYSEYLKLGGREGFGKFAATMNLCDPEATYFHFDRVIEMYERSAGPDRVLVLPYELLRDDPEGFLQRIEDRFRLDRHRPDLGRVNPRLSPLEMDGLPRVAQMIARLPGAALRGAIQDAYVRGARNGMVKRLLPRRWAKKSEGRSSERFEIDLSALRGTAASLKNRPDFARYRAEYLNDGRRTT